MPYSKFDNAMDEALHTLAGHGFADEESGSVFENGEWCALIKAPLSPTPDIFEGLSEEDEDELRKYAGAIVQEDTVGFVNVAYYEDEDQLANHWAQIQQEHMEQDGPQDDDWVTTDHLVYREQGTGNEMLRLHELYLLDDDARRMVLLARMECQQYWPNVWLVDDHGGSQLIKLGD